MRLLSLIWHEVVFWPKTGTVDHLLDLMGDVLKVCVAQFLGFGTRIRTATGLNQAYSNLLLNKPDRYSSANSSSSGSRKVISGIAIA
jgi:hypothetical protein